MKIGIITFHRAENFGAVLQCYALQEYLRSIGHEVYVIDYRSKCIDRFYYIWNPSILCTHRLFKGPLQTYIKRFIHIKERIRRKVLYKEFRSHYLKLSRKVYRVTDIPMMDVYITGSDQVWHTEITNGVDNIYFLNFSTPGNVIKMSYAASSDINSYASLNDYSQIIKAALDKYSMISVRENQLKTVISAFIDKEIKVCIDPTFLIETNVYHKIAIKPREDRYILVYHLVESTEAVRLAEKISKERNQPIIEIHAGYVNKRDRSRHKLDLGPLELLGYIEHADLVLTTSFHGMALAMKFHKNFWVFNIPKISRMSNILESVGYENRIINKVEEFSNAAIDYTMVDQKLSKIIQNSKDYLLSI